MRRFPFIIALLLLPSLAQAQTGAPSLDTYQTWLRTAYAAATRADRIGLDAIATQLENTTAVQLPNGSSVTVNNRWLQDALAQEPPPYDLITGRLGALLDALDQPAAATNGDGQQQLRNVFNRDPFVAIPRRLSFNS